MKKTKSQALIQKLINNKISREEFEDLLLGLEDEEEAVFLENSLREHFDLIMNNYETHLQSAKKIKKPDQSSEQV